MADTVAVAEVAQAFVGGWCDDKQVGVMMCISRHRGADSGCVGHFLVCRFDTQAPIETPVESNVD